jgi:hypothetical protein
MPQVRDLSGREFDVARGLAHGYSYLAIAQMLSIIQYHMLSLRL